MHRAEVINRLKTHADAIRAFGVTELYLYGSAARDEVGVESDIDLFVDVDYDRFGFVAFMDLREFMRNVFGRRVDLTTRNALHPDLKEDIVRSAIKVFDEEGRFARGLVATDQPKPLVFAQHRNAGFLGLVEF
jgi:predicted nucleotidyltransferase